MIKVFGGGNMFLGRNRGSMGVAQRNIEAARCLLGGRGLTASVWHVGGQGYRNVIFDIARGEVWVRHVGLRRASGWA
ncbi:hypothetical protein CAI21_12500 [Alkalilimnicola ehrlichii]|uniref:Chemoreceptor glutamine deamidase CheD n=1 Tax=Alkalilimnicola ehrlichii TaxID=351052 RepID=A0A3E0WZM7_9GAMM|nr:hypothetical protein CAI21_12500 [Alkalilimnicola ehrlichii]RFA38549.1 hypothetical protein CAL65_04160 [Alkalilimnicola ehrlichii]